jgi:hypothetical protein
MILLNEKPFHTLDNYLTIPQFLELKDDFYFLFSKNLDKSISTWTAGGIPTDCSWPYLTEPAILYYSYHGDHDEDTLSKIEYFNKENDRQGLATFLQLKYGSFNPYRILHLLDYTPQHKFEPFVNSVIRDWAYSLPYERLDSISLFYTDHFCPLKYHRDYNYLPYEKGYNPNVPDTIQDIIWLRFDLGREFFLYEIDENGTVIKSVPVEGHSITFNHYNWHGNINSYDKASLTVKVEGKFKPDFKYV